MKGFAKVTKLSNIGGRADYISNPERQENIVMKSESVDWKPYQDYERNHQMSDKKNNEGREVVMALPNEWVELPGEELKARAQCLAEIAVGKNTDLQWAIHWNKDHTNLHMHVIFSERQREEKGTWDRDIYLTSDGKVARRKADRAKNPDGTFKPPVHRKGEEKGGFTVKDKKYKKRSWVYEMKNDLKEQFIRYGVQMDKSGLLHEFHEGKGSESSQIRSKNELIRATNEIAGVYREKFPALSEKTLKKIALDAVKDGYVLKVAEIDGKLMKGKMTIEESREYSRQLTEPQKTRSEQLKDAYEGFAEYNPKLIALEKERGKLKKPFFLKHKEVEAYNHEMERLNAEIDKVKAPRQKYLETMESFDVNVYKAKDYDELKELVMERCMVMDKEDQKQEEKEKSMAQQSDGKAPQRERMGSLKAEINAMKRSDATSAPVRRDRGKSYGNSHEDR